MKQAVNCSRIRDAAGEMPPLIIMAEAGKEEEGVAPVIMEEAPRDEEIDGNIFPKNVDHRRADRFLLLIKEAKSLTL